MKELWLLESYRAEDRLWYPAGNWYATRELALAARDKLASYSAWEWRVSRYVREEAN